MSPSTCLTPSDMKPQERITSSTPCRRTQSSMNDRNGWPARGITGLGVVSVSGLSRVPSPPASTRACIRLPADPLVCEAAGHELLAVEEVAPVHDERDAHALLHLAGPVELAELGPLRDEHHGVRPVHGLERRPGDPGAREHVLRLLARDRVVCAHARALAREAPRQHEA